MRDAVLMELTDTAQGRAGEPGELTVGQVVSSEAARARAAQIDELLGGTRIYDGPATEGLRQAFDECDLVVSHLAIGATTRILAPLLDSKKTDPGVVVIDQGGHFVVPLLGGHVGGANELAEKLSEALGATAVLTTATEQHPACAEARKNCGVACATPTIPRRSSR